MDERLRSDLATRSIIPIERLSGREYHRAKDKEGIKDDQTPLAASEWLSHVAIQQAPFGSLRLLHAALQLAKANDVVQCFTIINLHLEISNYKCI